MASRLFGKTLGRRFLAGTSVAGAATFSGIKAQGTESTEEVTLTPAEAQFGTSSIHPTPVSVPFPKRYASLVLYHHLRFASSQRCLW